MLPIVIQKLADQITLFSGWFKEGKLSIYLFNRRNSPTSKVVNHFSINQTFLGSINPEDIAAVTAAQIKTLQTQPQLTESAPTDLLLGGLPEGSSTGTNDEFKIGINKRIDEGVALLNLNRLDDARNLFTTILGEIKNHPHMEKELGRVYNNTGVTYNSPAPGGDYDKAIHFFTLAIEADATMWKAKMNLAHALLNKGDTESVIRGYEQAQVLWAVEKNPDTLLVLLISIRKNDSTDKVFEFLASEPEATQKMTEKDNVLGYLATAHLEKNDYKQALAFIDRALLVGPNEPEYLSVKARALIVRAQNEHRADSEFDIVPRLNDYEDVRNALVFFEAAGVAAAKQGKGFLLTETRHGMAVCQLWLNRFSDSLKNLKLLKLDDASDEMVHHQLDVLSLDIAIKKRDFETAFATLTEGVGYPHILYPEKRRLARVFIINGGLEQAKALLNEIQVEAEQRKDVTYWFDLSAVCVLLSQKNEAITAATQARKLAEESEHLELKRMALSHYNAIMFHYAKPDDGEDSETSRLMLGIQDFQSQFPDEEIVTSIQAIDDQGDLTTEMKGMLESRKEHFQQIKEIYQSQPLTIYHLEKFFKRDLVDVATSGGPDFPLFFSDVNEPFLKQIHANFKLAEALIFDYLSLLDLAKMGFLGLLERTGKQVFVHELLFRKIQEELLAKEVIELRMLWDFLRKSKSVQIIRETPDYEFNNKDTDKLFDTWLVQTLGFARTGKAVLVTDDVRLLAFARSEDIVSTNVLAFIQHWTDTGLIDAKMKSRSIGDLAERFYTFLSFTGEDLFEIVLEDKAKITPRSFHLVREIFLPGSEPASFIGPFIRFVDLLWKTGVLAQEKVQWLSFISSVITEVIDKEFATLKLKETPGKNDAAEALQRLQPLTTGLAIIWKNATKIGTRDDLREALRMIDQALGREYFSKSKEKIIEQMNARLTQLSGS